MNLGWHWTPTHVRDFNYVKKEGNYYCSWEGAIAKFSNIELLYWQQQAMVEWDLQDDRTITVIYDFSGNHGKSWLAKHMVATHKAEYVPPMTEALDFMAFAMAKPSKGYIIDMPRAETIKQRKGMWSAIEQMKNGYIYDKRYNFRDAWIEPPKIIVMCNELPDLTTLSLDRWSIRRINEMPDGTAILCPIDTQALYEEQREAKKSKGEVKN